VNNESVIQFTSTPVQVAKKVSYDVLSVLKRTKFNNNKGGNKMETNECTPCIAEKVTALIAHAKTKFTEDDRDFLQGLQEVQLDKLEPVEEAVIEVNAEEKKVEKPAEAIEALSEEDKSALAYGKQQLKAYRDNLINGIQANTKEGLWTPEVLSKMDNSILENISKSVIPVENKETLANYALNGGEIVKNSEGDELVMPPAGVVLETK